MTQKREFVRPAGLLPEERSANALEFIAEYLDRIDGHLETLASAQTVGSLEGIRMSLVGITGILNSTARD